MIRTLDELFELVEESDTHWIDIVIVLYGDICYSLRDERAVISELKCHSHEHSPIILKELKELLKSRSRPFKSIAELFDDYDNGKFTTLEIASLLSEDILFQKVNEADVIEELRMSKHESSQFVLKHLSLILAVSVGPHLPSKLDQLISKRSTNSEPE